MLPEDKPVDYPGTRSNAASHENVDSQAVNSSEVQVMTEANKTAGDNTRAGRIGAACAILSRLPPVMAVIQDVMAGKRTRTQAEDDTEEIPGEPANKTPRNRHTVAESVGDGHEFDQDEELLDRVFVRPRTARVREPEENTVTEGNRMRVPENRSEERIPMARDLATENDEASPTNLVDPLTPEATDMNEDRRDQSRKTNSEKQVPEWIQEIRRRPAAVKVNRPPPINLMKGMNSYNIEEAMVNIKPEITFPQLLDVSPRLRRELAILLRSSQPRTRKKRTQMEIQIDNVTKVTDAAPDSEVECMYITVWCNGVEIPDVLVNGGAMIDLIAKDVVDKLQLEKHPVHNLGMRLADDSLVPLESYVWLDVNVEGVVAKVRAYVMPVTVTYRILLSRRWLKRMKGVEHHATNTLIIQGIDGVKRSTKGRPAPPAELEIVGIRNTDLAGSLQRNIVTGDDDEYAEDAVDALLHELDDWECSEPSGNGLHRR